MGDPRMSDQAFGLKLAAFGTKVQYAQQTVAQAKNLRMSDGMALAIGELLAKERPELISHPAEVILVAHAERKRDRRVKNALLEYAKKTLAAVPTMAAKVLAGLAVAPLLALSLSAHDAHASVGGAGGKRA